MIFFFDFGMECRRIRIVFYGFIIASGYLSSLLGGPIYSQDEFAEYGDWKVFPSDILLERSPYSGTGRVVSTGRVEFETLWPDELSDGFSKNTLVTLQHPCGTVFPDQSIKVFLLKMHNAERIPLNPLRTLECRTLFRPGQELTPGSTYAVLVTSVAKSEDTVSHLAPEYVDFLESIERVSGFSKKSIVHAEQLTIRSDTTIFGPLLLLRNRIIGATSGSNTLHIDTVDKGDRFYSVAGSIQIPDFCEVGCLIMRSPTDVSLPVKRKPLQFRMYIPIGNRVRGYLQIAGFQKNGYASETGIFFRILEEMNLAGLFIESEIPEGGEIRTLMDVNTHIVSWMYQAAISSHLIETLPLRINELVPGILDRGLPITGFCIEQDLCPRGMALNPYVSNTVVVVRNPPPFRITNQESTDSDRSTNLWQDGLLFDLNTKLIRAESSYDKSWLRILSLFERADLKKIGDFLKR